MEVKQTPAAAPHLAHREAFEAVLKDYRINEAAKKVLASTKLVLLSGPSASGRNTVINYLVEHKDYHFIVSDTTRPPRVNNGILEQNGREYWFRTEEEVLDDLKRGEFLEAELIHKQQVSGISMRELERASAKGKIAINEVEIGGFQNVLKVKPDTVAIMLLPPDFTEWQRRLMGRGVMSSTELKNRLETAEHIFTDAREKEYATIVINDTVEHAAEQIDSIVRTGSVDDAAQAQARQLAAELIEQTKAWKVQL